MTTQPTTPISWTPAQAGYWPRDTRITTTRDNGEGCPVHFVDTRHGIVARTFVGDCMEIVLWRPANIHPTFQGFVELVTVDGVRGWVGFDPHGRRVTKVHPNYIGAEAPLLRMRTGRRSRADLPWVVGSAARAGMTPRTRNLSGDVHPRD